MWKNVIRAYTISHGHLGMGACFHGIFFAIFLMVS